MQKLSMREKVEYWREHISRFVGSNKTQKQYCRENDISYSKFKRWRYKFPKDFPVSQNRVIPTNKESKSGVRDFAAIKIIDDVSDKESKGQIT